MNAHRPLSLFRLEVAEARRERLAGEIILAQPVRAHVLTLLLVVIIALVALWIVLGTYTRSEIAPGILVTDQPSAKIVAIRPGQIAQLLVGEGDRVEAGQKLAMIQTEAGSEEGGSHLHDNLVSIDAQRSLAKEQERLADLRASADRARIAAAIDGLQQQRHDLAAQIGLQEEVVGSARETFDRLASVLEKGFVSRIEYERRRQLYLTAQQQLAQLRLQSNSLASEDRKALAELTRIAADAGTQVAAARTSGETLVQQRAAAIAHDSYIITAPVAGRITAVQASVGRAVDASSPLMTIVPDGSALHAELYAPTRAIGFVKPGQEVRLLYDAFPYQRFGSFKGRVMRVSRTIMDPREIAAPLKVEEAVYRIHVVLDRQAVKAFGDKLALQPGMTLKANLILDRRSFGDWLLRPINAVLRRSQ